MRKKLIVLAVVALAVPSVALADKGGGHGHQGKSAPNVLYILRGTLSGYAAASSGTDGSITIDVKASNRHGRALRGQTLQLPLSDHTRIVMRHGTTAIADGDRGIVKVRAPKRVAAADLPATLQAAMARQVIDQGAPKS
jgi:hypothetical protein